MHLIANNCYHELSCGTGKQRHRHGTSWIDIMDYYGIVTSDTSPVYSDVS